MNNFILPNLYSLKELNFNLISLQSQYPNFFKSNYRIVAIKGNFPFCVANGQFNINIYKECASIYDIRNLYQTILTLKNTIIILDFSNYLLTKEILSDNRYINIILKEANSFYPIIISDNLDIYNYFRKEYPFTELILSENNTLYTANAINEINENQSFKYIYLNDMLAYDLNEVQKLIPKNKIVINLNPKCPHDCGVKQTECYLLENTHQFNFSEQSSFLTCPINLIKDISNDTLLFFDIKEYNKLGINHFSFNNFYFTNKEKVKQFYIKFFIKPEYYYESYLFLKDLELSNSND